MAERHIGIFISSPGDVVDERRRAAIVINRLAREFSRFFDVTPVLWEYEPMLASGHFQDAIIKPSTTDIVVLILWSRLGTVLPERFRGIDGRTPVTGTEWEYEEALAHQRERGVPDLLVYRKDEEGIARFSRREQLDAASAQWEALESFWQRHFLADDGGFRAAFKHSSPQDRIKSAPPRPDTPHFFNAIDSRPDLRHRQGAISRRRGRLARASAESRRICATAGDRDLRPFVDLRLSRYSYIFFFMKSGLVHIERLALSHGAACWVLAYLGLHGGGDAQIFDAYIKSLRRDGVPFARDELGVGRGHNLKYRYHHLMELAVALALRTQGILSRDIVGLLAFHRILLRSHYHRAWLERESGLGASRKVVIDGTLERWISGAYLTLELTYNFRGALSMIPPKLIDPAEAFDHYMGFHQQVYPRPPLPISQIAEDIVRLAEGAPEIKRGRRA